MKAKGLIIIITLMLSVKSHAQTEIDYLSQENFTFPAEDQPHEGTWLQWPHSYQYGVDYQRNLEPTWIAMAIALSLHEKVHIIVYDSFEKQRVQLLLENTDAKIEHIDYTILKTDDVWIRDNGPIFVKDENDSLTIIDFGFNAWGGKIDELTGDSIQYKNCNRIPTQIGRLKNRRVIDFNDLFVIEGGSFEVEGNGTLMACKSSIINKNRNPHLPIDLVEFLFEKYLGVSNFIWLEGEEGYDITDQHIDGFARFRDSTYILTMKGYNLKAFDVNKEDIERLYKAKNKNGKGYTFVFLPLTKRKVRTTHGISTGSKGTYLNYYVANNVVLVPNYNDKNDDFANKIIQSMYPNRKVIGIDVRNLFANGGAIHCVTQQQPAN